jgi:glycosyltransferase involved in cell wall biosynthesis
VTDALWQGADLFALASYFEGYGVAVAEALRRGLPVAATSVGAVPALVGPEAGVVCAPGDVDQLSKAMRRLIFDRTLRQEMAEVAWQSSRSLPSWNEQAAQLAAVLAHGTA